MIVSGNTILITGGSSGIGLALAKRFLELKNKVIITGRDDLKLAGVKKEFPEILTFAGDLTNQDSLHELAAFIRDKHPRLNMLINNAAVQYNYVFTEEPDVLSKIAHEISTNLTAPVQLTALLVPVLLKNGNSAVINVSSGLFMAPKKSASIYCASKAAIHSFSKTLRYQLEDTGTKVFEIIPALVDTPMTAGRGKSKISAEQLTDEFIRDLQADRHESYIGKSKWLKRIHRLFPKLADKMMKNGR